MKSTVPKSRRAMSIMAGVVAILTGLSASVLISGPAKAVAPVVALVNGWTGDCLDSNYSGDVYGHVCNGGYYQQWIYDGERLVNRETGLCLTGTPLVTTDACIGSEYQKWYRRSAIYHPLNLFNRGTNFSLMEQVDTRKIYARDLPQATGELAWRWSMDPVEVGGDPADTSGDFDGDRKADYAVWRPSSGVWFVKRSSNGVLDNTISWGENGDIPVPADYDGDGLTDRAVWRKSNSTFYVWQSSTNSNIPAVQLGQTGDIPISAPLMERFNMVP